MTEFMQKECYRLIDKLAETDPTTEAYHIVLSSIERLDAIGSTIDEIAKSREQAPQELVIKGSLDKVIPFEAPSFPAEDKDEPGETPEEKEGHEVAELVKRVVEPPKEEKTYQSSDVRAALVDARGRGVNVGEILQRFGVSNFQFLPATQYGALIEALKAV